jgi:hypothetical protein
MAGIGLSAWGLTPILETPRRQGSEKYKRRRIDPHFFLLMIILSHREARHIPYC